MNTAEGAVGQHEPSSETFCKLDTIMGRLITQISLNGFF